MKRDIKFRVWDNVDYMSAPFTLRDVQEKKIEFTSDCVLMQFTGLLDKNGKEIFEGDVLQIETDKPMVVGWSQKFASFVLNRDGWMFSHWFGESCEPSQCVIVGNIHQNPELLK